MTNTAPIALMAAALFLAVQGQPRADVFVVAKCPCGFTADIIPPEDWLGKVECKLGDFGAGDQTQLVALPKAGVFKSRALVAPLYLGGFCSRRDAGGVLALKEQILSHDQMRACDWEIIVYAQELKNQKDWTGARAWWVSVVDNGCNLK